MANEMVLVSADRLQRLEDSERFLECLEWAGVDNWEGHSLAWQLYEGEIDPETY